VTTLNHESNHEEPATPVSSQAGEVPGLDTPSNLAPANEQAAGVAPDSEASAELLDEDQRRIWVGSWLDYNNGVLHGDWIDAGRLD